MSKQHRTKLIKSLEQQLEATDDPKIKADISRQLTKLLAKPSRKGSPRKPEATAPSSTKLSIIDRITGSAVDTLSDWEKVQHWVIEQVEKLQREQRRKFTTEEVQAAIKKLIEGLSARDRAALESQNTEKDAV